MWGNVDDDPYIFKPSSSNQDYKSDSYLSASSSDNSTRTQTIPCTICTNTYYSKIDRNEHEIETHGYNNKAFINVRNSLM